MAAITGRKSPIPLETFPKRILEHGEGESDPPSPVSLTRVELLSGSQATASDLSNDQKQRQQQQSTTSSFSGKEPILNQDGGRYEEPDDRYNLVYIIMIIHGIAVLMPWNAFINASVYFTDFKLMKTLSNGTKIASPYREYFMANLGIASQFPNVIFNVLNIFFQVGGGNLNKRVLISIGLELILMIFTISLAVINTSEKIAMFFYLTMITVVVLNMVNGIYQNSLYGLASKLPMIYTNAIITGSNTCGVFTSLVNILSIWLAPNTRQAAIYYFSSTIVILIIAFISFLLLPMSAFFRHYFSQDNREVSLNNVEQKNETGQKLIEDSSVPPSQPYLYVLGFAWKQCLNVFLVFFVTLSLFPNILSATKAVNPSFFGSTESTDRYFIAVSCFLTFNLFAMIGSIIPSLVIFPSPDNLWIPVVARFLFIPFFLLCNCFPEKRLLPVFIQSDGLYVFGNVLMALSSGYYSSLSMMFASKSVPDPQYSGIAGMMAGASLACGIFFGVNFSLLLSWLMKN